MEMAAHPETLTDQFQEHLKSCQNCRRDWPDYQRDHEMRRFQRLSAWLLGAVLATMVLVEIFRSFHASH